jgi:hypothetical protein
MCDDCTKHRVEIKADLVAVLMGDPDSRLTIALDETVEKSLPAIHARIDAAVEEGRVRGDKPSDEEIREAVRDCLLGAILATGGASIASATPGYTDESKLACSMILGMWAGAVLGSEMQSQVQSEADIVRHLLGMGDN